MHWRRVPGNASGKAFYIVVSVLIASAMTLLALHFQA
jgi:hypothetical protein